MLIARAAGIVAFGVSCLSTPALACEQWDLAGDFSIEHANAITVLGEMQQSGGVLTGRARFYSTTLQKGTSILVGGNLKGSVTGDQVRFRIDWAASYRKESPLPDFMNGTDVWSSTGVYEGTIGGDGRVEGVSFDVKDSQNKTTWFMRDPAKCAIASPPPREKIGPGMDDDTNRVGADYRKFELDGKSPEVCQATCMKERASCRAWTYVRPGVQGPTALCYLKSSVPPATKNACCISGVLPDVDSPIDPGAAALPAYGGIGEKYAKLGGPGGALGPPLEAEKDARHGGRCQAFRHGTICWHPEIGEAFALWGAIHDKWVQAGRVDYGYPITDEVPTTDGRGRYNHFRGMQYPGRPESSIYWSPQTGAHAIYGLIRDAWAKQGWERGPLGYPKSDEYQDGKFRRVNFERGMIRWSVETGIESWKND